MRTITRVVVFSGIFLLSACSGKHVHTARIHLLNQSFANVAACVGVPDKTLILNPTTKIIEWDYGENKISSSFSLSAISTIFAPILAVPNMLMSGDQLSINGDGNCKAVAKFTNDKLTTLKFGGDNTTLFTGKDGVCEPLFRGCLP